jgi:hypothetical protein
MDETVGKLYEAIGQYSVQISELKDCAPPDYLTAAINKLVWERDAARDLLELRADQIRAITKWLDDNQHDVWFRGLWDAINAAKRKL